MNLWKMAYRNIEDHAFRSLVILLCAMLIAAFVVSATLVIGGAQRSLNLALERLGADIIVVSAGSEHLMENAFLMGVPAPTWMPRAYVDTLATVDGIQAVSPQFFLATLRGATCCSVPEMLLIAYDPATDFTLRPWLETHLPQGLGANQAIGGAFIFTPAGADTILIYGTDISLLGNLEPTGTGLDRSMFITFETAHAVAASSYRLAESPLEIPADSVSAAMLRLSPNADPRQVAARIQQALPDTTPVISTSLFSSQRQTLSGLLRTILLLLLVFWVLALSLVGLVFSIAVNERRREIGVLRSLGATRPLVLRSLLLEGSLLAIAGGTLGSGLALLVVYLFRTLIIQQMGIPFLLPAWYVLLALGGGAMLLTLSSVLLAALFPSLRISRMDPALAMRD
jgi:putative ABC transport system permease protein